MNHIKNIKNQIKAKIILANIIVKIQVCFGKSIYPHQAQWEDFVIHGHLVGTSGR